MIYRVEYISSARRELKKLKDPVLQRLLDAIWELRNDPRQPGTKKLKNSDKWRLRVGDYRVVYEIYDTKLVVSVVTVAHRKDVYRKR